ncbi:MAG: GTP cyclohydrolase I FolE [Candidatus Dormibacteraeota bacterium]|nr:GTP cyclohydrolase I FolE [Candidatus Dormibacteraeota bacterium]
MADARPISLRPHQGATPSPTPIREDDPVGPIISSLLRELGEDPAREGLLRTPDRVADSLRFLLSGYTQDVADVVNGAVYAEDYREMVLVRDIELYSLCEHHLLPFFGKAHVAYLPKGRIIGLSKLPRIVEVFARRLQVQERLTTQIADALDGALEPYGTAVVIEASHLCMMMRGVEKQNSRTVTSALTGAFQRDPKCRNEFLELVGRT